MSLKIAPEANCLMLESDIKNDNSLGNEQPETPRKPPSISHEILANKLTGCFPHSKCILVNNTKQLQAKQYHVTNMNDYLKTQIKKRNYSSNKTSQLEVKQLEEEKDLLQRNYSHEVEYYVRQRMKDLLTIHQLLIANQIQRVQEYVQTELNQLRKMHEFYFSLETCYKYHFTSGLEEKLSIDDDQNYNQLITNLIQNIKQFEIGNNFLIPLLHRLGREELLSTSKLAWYFEQVPLEIASHRVSKTLAGKLIDQLGCTDGRKVLEIISKSVQKKSKGKYKIYQYHDDPKSQISKLIQQFSNTKFKNYEFQEIEY